MSPAHGGTLTLLGLVIGCGAGDDVESVRDGDRSAAAADSVWTVGHRNYGPIPLGVPFEEANTAAGGAIEQPDSLEGCTTAVIEDEDGVWLMVVDGRVVRVDVRTPNVETREGAGVGDPEDRVRALYPGRVEVQPHKYTEGHYLVVTPEDGSDHRLIFETEGGLVRRYRAGVLPEVAWVEGCG